MFYTSPMRRLWSLKEKMSDDKSYGTTFSFFRNKIKRLGTAIHDKTQHRPLIFKVTETKDETH